MSKPIMCCQCTPINRMDHQITEGYQGKYGRGDENQKCLCQRNLKFFSRKDKGEIKEGRGDVARRHKTHSYPE